MAYIGRQQSSGAFLKLDGISSQFNNSTTTFNLTIGGEAFFAGNPYSLLVSLGGVIQEPIKSFTIVENQINFASAPANSVRCFVIYLGRQQLVASRTATDTTPTLGGDLDLGGNILTQSGSINFTGYTSDAYFLVYTATASQGNRGFRIGSSSENDWFIEREASHVFVI